MIIKNDNLFIFDRKNIWLNLLKNIKIAKNKYK